MTDELDDIGRHCTSLPLRDRRSEDEILGHDENGISSDRWYLGIGGNSVGRALSADRFSF